MCQRWTKFYTCGHRTDGSTPCRGAQATPRWPCDPGSCDQRETIYVSGNCPSPSCPWRPGFSFMCCVCGTGGNTQAYCANRVYDVWADLYPCCHQACQYCIITS